MVGSLSHTCFTWRTNAAPSDDQKGDDPAASQLHHTHTQPCLSSDPTAATAALPPARPGHGTSRQPVAPVWMQLGARERRAAAAPGQLGSPRGICAAILCSTIGHSAPNGPSAKVVSLRNNAAPSEPICSSAWNVDNDLIKSQTSRGLTYLLDDFLQGVLCTASLSAPKVWGIILR